MTQPVRYAGWAVWVRWVVATSVTARLSYFVAGALVTARAESDTLGKAIAGSNFMTGDNALGPLLLWSFLLIVLIGPLTGLAQDLVLRNVHACVDWRKWIVATSLGTAAAILASAITYLGVILPGVIIGFAQWLVLRQCLQKANAWIVATAGAQIVALLAGLITVSYFLPKSWIEFVSWPFYPLRSVIYWSIGFTVGMVVFAALTGLALIWMLQDHIEDQRS